MSYTYLGTARTNPKFLLGWIKSVALSMIEGWSNLTQH